MGHLEIRLRECGSDRIHVPHGQNGSLAAAHGRAHVCVNVNV
jgi:hypothetical protein